VAKTQTKVFLRQKPSIPGKPWDKEANERIATALLEAHKQRCGGYLEYPLNLLEIAEKELHFKVVYRAMALGQWGMCSFDDSHRLITISTAIEEPIQRFTLAHEMAHVLKAEANGEQAGSSTDLSDDLQNIDEPHSESEVNHLAACILMPREELLRVWNGLIQSRHLELQQGVLVDEGVRCRHIWKREFLPAFLRHFNTSVSPMVYRLSTVPSQTFSMLPGSLKEYLLSSDPHIKVQKLDGVIANFFMQR
jgi:Zn-dependent peptidase ImmA (M78 family)